MKRQYYTELDCKTHLIVSITYALYNVNVERHVKQYSSNNMEIPFISIGIGGEKTNTSGETNDQLKITVKRDIAGTRLMSARACPHADRPTHCTSRALAAPRFPTVQLSSEDASYQRGGYCRSLGNVESMYWQERLTHSAFFSHTIC